MRGFAARPAAVVLLCAMTVVAGSIQAAPPDAAFTYQGKLTDGLGNPLSGSYDTDFRLFDVATGGSQQADCFPPVIYTNPEDQSVCSGSPFEFSVEADDSEPLSFQWRLNEAPINGATSSVYGLSSATTADAGVYDCIVSNSCDSTTSLPASLKVFACMSIPEAKRLPDGSAVNIRGRTATYSGVDFFYIEEDSRASGLRVESPAHRVPMGEGADVEGTIRTNADGERYVEASLVVDNEPGNAAPVAMLTRSLGGGGWFWVPGGTSGQRGVKNGFGLNNIGLLVAVLGKVTYSCTDYFYVDDGSMLDDGSGHKGVRVLSPDGSNPDGGGFVGVGGISSCLMLNGDIRPVILPIAFTFPEIEQEVCDLDAVFGSLLNQGFSPEDAGSQVVQIARANPLVKSATPCNNGAWVVFKPDYNYIFTCMDEIGTPASGLPLARATSINKPLASLLPIGQTTATSDGVTLPWKASVAAIDTLVTYYQHLYWRYGVIFDYEPTVADEITDRLDKSFGYLVSRHDGYLSHFASLPDYGVVYVRSHGTQTIEFPWRWALLTAERCGYLRPPGFNNATMGTALLHEKIMIDGCPNDLGVGTYYALFDDYFASFWTHQPTVFIADFCKSNVFNTSAYYQLSWDKIVEIVEADPDLVALIDKLVPADNAKPKTFEEACQAVGNEHLIGTPPDSNMSLLPIIETASVTRNGLSDILTLTGKFPANSGPSDAYSFTAESTANNGFINIMAWKAPTTWTPTEITCDITGAAGGIQPVYLGIGSDWLSRIQSNHTSIEISPRGFPVLVTHWREVPGGQPENMGARTVTFTYTGCDVSYSTDGTIDLYIGDAVGGSGCWAWLSSDAGVLDIGDGNGEFFADQLSISATEPNPNPLDYWVTVSGTISGLLRRDITTDPGQPEEWETAALNGASFVGWHWQRLGG